MPHIAIVGITEAKVTKVLLVAIFVLLEVVIDDASNNLATQESIVSIATNVLEPALKQVGYSLVDPHYIVLI